MRDLADGRGQPFLQRIDFLSPFGRHLVLCRAQRFNDLPAFAAGEVDAFAQHGDFGFGALLDFSMAGIELLAQPEQPPRVVGERALGRASAQVFDAGLDPGERQGDGALGPVVADLPELAVEDVAREQAPLFGREHADAHEPLHHLGHALGVARHRRLRAEALDDAAHERPDARRGDQHRFHRGLRGFLEPLAHQRNELG